MSNKKGCSVAILLTLLAHDAVGFASIPRQSRKAQHSLNIMHERKDNSMETTKRREFLYQTLSIATLATTVGAPSSANAVERAVGGAEISCREEGNCLQKFEIDGAVGWNWGGKDRCDA